MSWFRCVDAHRNLAVINSFRCSRTALGRGAPQRYRLDEQGPLRPPYQGVAMSDKNPRQAMSKKSGKSLKEKRADKRGQSDQSPSTDVIAHTKKR